MIKKLMGCIREYKKHSILSPIFVALEVILEVIIPFLMAQIVDFGVGEGNIDYIIKIGFFLILSTIFSLLFGVLSGKYSATASSGFAKNVRHDLYYSIQNFSFSNIDKFSTSGLITRLTTDVTNVQNSYQMIVRILVRSPLMLVFSLAMAFSVNHQISLIFLGAILVLGVGLFLIIMKAHPIFKKVFKRYDDLNNVVQENLRGIRAVKSYVREDYEEKKFQDVSKTIFEEFTKAEKIIAFNSPLMQFVMYASMLLISWLGARMIISDTMSTGQLMGLMTYAIQILMSLMMLSMVLTMIAISRASAERIAEVLGEEPDLHNSENPVYQIADGSITFENVSFGYSKKGKLAMEGVTLKIRSGDTVGIIGGTGSAKTSLVQLIPRLYDVTNGVVKVGVLDVRAYDLKALRNEVSMVLQKNVLFSGTIKENLRWGDASATDEELARVCRLAQADGFIQGFPDKYDTYIEQGGTNVSGGQKQRLCIARALLKKPKILILDDSTSAVDTKTDALIRQAFKEEIPDTTKIIIAQRISSIEDADQIIVMDGGKIDAVGTHDELMEKSRIYQEVYRSQIKGGEDVA